MTETLPHLLALQACDQYIQQVAHTLQTLQRSLVALQQEEQTTQQDIQVWQEKIREAEQTHSDLISQLRQVKGQLRGRQNALRGRRTRQQEETGQQEAIHLEANKAALGEELQTVAAQIAEATVALHRLEAMAPAHHEEVLRTASSLLGQIATAEEELRGAQDRRTALVTEVPPFLLQEYERVFLRRGGLAVVALTNETCQGCHMRLPPQMCLELQKNHRLTFCPHCRRILFAPMSTTLPGAESHAPANGTHGHHPRQPQQRRGDRMRTGKEPHGTVLSPASPRE